MVDSTVLLDTLPGDALLSALPVWACEHKVIMLPGYVLGESGLAVVLGTTVLTGKFLPLVLQLNMSVQCFLLWIDFFALVTFELFLFAHDSSAGGRTAAPTRGLVAPFYRGTGRPYRSGAKGGTGSPFFVF